MKYLMITCNIKIKTKVIFIRRPRRPTFFLPLVVLTVWPRSKDPILWGRKALRPPTANESASTTMSKWRGFRTSRSSQRNNNLNSNSCISISNNNFLNSRKKNLRQIRKKLQKKLKRFWGNWWARFCFDKINLNLHFDC